MTVLSKSLIAFLFSEISIGLLFVAVFYFAFKILKNWNFNNSTPLQYSLEKNDFFVSLIVYFALIVKILLLPFFINILDELSIKIPGAMCGAGVIRANEYGEILLTLKIFTIFTGGIWLLLNKIDKTKINLPFTKIRYIIFFIVFGFVATEGIFEYLYFLNLNTNEVVQCCSIIYGSNLQSPLPFGLTTQLLLILFTLMYLLIVLSYFANYKFINALSNLIFLFVGYYSLSYFFSTYVYELPTHKCPFCLFQKEYYYVGYILWGSLIGGVFYSISGYIINLITKQNTKKLFSLSLKLNSFFVFLCTFYVFSYYLKNGVFL